ncbi:hypothetical protein D3C76_1406360 [compost metagenome]
MQIVPGTVAVKQLRLFSQQQTVASPGVDIALQSGSVIEDLSATFEQVRDRSNVRVFQAEGQFAVRLGQPLADNRCVVGETSLAHVLDSVGTRGTRGDQIADGQSALRSKNDADALRRYQCATRCRR